MTKICKWYKFNDATIADQSWKKLRFEERFQVFKALVYKEDWIQNYN